MSQYQQEQERIKRLGSEDFWGAVDVSWEEYQAQKPVRKKAEQEKSNGNQRN